MIRILTFNMFIIIQVFGVFCVVRTSHTHAHTHLGEIIDQGEMSLLQLCPGQSRQRVGIVQLFAVV